MVFAGRDNVLLRFADLKRRGIVQNWVTLGEWIRHRGFPPGYMLTPKHRCWPEAEVEAWLEARRIPAPPQDAA